MAKTLIVGLDGATNVVIKPLMERGKLPNLRKR
jgi:predicted AlkP superfamily phosphohydrolase/phosphomutase